MKQISSSDLLCQNSVLLCVSPHLDLAFIKGQSGGFYGSNVDEWAIPERVSDVGCRINLSSVLMGAGFFFFVWGHLKYLQSEQMLIFFPAYLNLRQTLWQLLVRLAFLGECQLSLVQIPPWAHFCFIFSRRAWIDCGCTSLESWTTRSFSVSRFTYW